MTLTDQTLTPSDSLIIHEKLSYQVHGALFEVHNHLGPKLTEQLYQKALTYVLIKRGIHCLFEQPFDIHYRDQLVGNFFVDLWIEHGKILIELKVAPTILPRHQAQTLSYLKLTNADLGIIANFGEASLRTKRLPNFLRNRPIDLNWQRPSVPTHLLHPELTNRLLEGLHRVHYTLGPGYVHRVYRQAVKIELDYLGLGYEVINQVPVYYEGHYLGLDETQMIKVEDTVLLGVFALEARDKARRLQMTRRLHWLQKKLGMLANFHGQVLDVEVVVGRK